MLRLSPAVKLKNIKDPVDHQKFAACVGRLFGLLIKMEEERPQLLRFSESLSELTEVLGL